MSSDPAAPSPSAPSPAVRPTLFSRRAFLFLLAALCVLRLVLNAFVPLMDPSEARYALICKIMAESGNYLEPKLIHEGVLMNFEGKPPLCFQAGAVACRIFGVKRRSRNSSGLDFTARRHRSARNHVTSSTTGTFSQLSVTGIHPYLYASAEYITNASAENDPM